MRSFELVSKVCDYARRLVRESQCRVDNEKSAPARTIPQAELKFAATDLKLYRRQQRTRIEHWDVWRQAQPPRSYFLWAARLEPSKEKIDVLVREARALIDTYLDGVGLIAWQPSLAGDAYEAVPRPAGERVTALDDVLYRIESHINASVDAHGNPPPPVASPEKGDRHPYALGLVRAASRPASVAMAGTSSTQRWHRRAGPLASNVPDGPCWDRGYRR